MPTFEQRLKEARLAKGLTQGDLAEMLGYSSKGSICMIETGKRSVPLEKMKEIAEKLDVDPTWLIGWDGDDEPLPEMSKTEAKYKKYFDVLNEIGQKKALDYLKDLADNDKYRQ